MYLNIVVKILQSRFFPLPLSSVCLTLASGVHIEKAAERSKNFYRFVDVFQFHHENAIIRLQRPSHDETFRRIARRVSIGNLTWFSNCFVTELSKRDRSLEKHRLLVFACIKQLFSIISQKKPDFSPTIQTQLISVHRRRRRSLSCNF